MKSFRIVRTVDDVLNVLEKRVQIPPIRAASTEEALSIFRATTHPMSQWSKVRAEEYSLVAQANDLADTTGAWRDRFDAFMELLTKIENLTLREEELRVKAAEAYADGRRSILAEEAFDDAAG